MRSADDLLHLLRLVQFDGRLTSYSASVCSPMSGQVNRGTGSCDQRNKGRSTVFGLLWTILHFWSAVDDFTFKVDLVAVVRVRAPDESIARKFVPEVLGAPGTTEIRQANENNAAKGRHATVIDVGFAIESIKPSRGRSR